MRYIVSDTVDCIGGNDIKFSDKLEPYFACLDMCKIS